jgi:hypothetical protein
MANDEGNSKIENPNGGGEMLKFNTFVSSLGAGMAAVLVWMIADAYHDLKGGMARVEASVTAMQLEQAEIRARVVVLELRRDRQ